MNIYLYNLQTIYSARRGVGILTQLWHKCLAPLSRSSTCRDCKCRDKEALREELLQWSRL